ncbi:leucine--tRNA ligase [Allorhodopirellula heiligendammensis]|uniref:Leucine--tRNA ligase n=1 Tax=Allorhodopirellula heiligendammensis TaxID=2714739 RepID=A0A5C6BEZ4_9BACT|nr:leucine--tRNA ligase [Allorhodopirellula heiligendammensis]TWU09849.1 Leucine--tRNA ligase [Allorhodopirellula heiligendammensis]
MVRYNPNEIEPRWQAYWETNQTFATPDLSDASGDVVKRYVLDMFPYPSGDGLHVGHPEGYTATDIVSRFARARGEFVLHPMGFDAFGLPAEEHAIRTGEHPRVQTQRNIDNFTRQLKMLGFSYDWNRVLATTDEGYFRWTQWIFLLLYDTWFDTTGQKGRPISELPIPAEVESQGERAIELYRDSRRLAYQDDALVNWCAKLGTVLANEEVVDGKSEVGGHPVKRIPLRQWMLRITDYAERLIDGLEDLQWPAGIKKLQSDWIGRSTGAEVDFYLQPGAHPTDAASDATANDAARGPYVAWKRERAANGFPTQPGRDALRVYTTRPDTLFGATYMVVSPEHPLIDLLVSPERKAEVDAYREQASFKSDRERTEGDRKKTGVFTGTHAINPADGRSIPVWVADYVLAGYGTGAIMAVPAHDIRDFEFAVAFDLPVIAVVDPPAEHAQREEILAGRACFVAEGVAINSGQYDGKTTDEVKSHLTSSLVEQGLARQAVNYKLRDWLFSRQRFWGEPFPILHELDNEGNPTGIKRGVPEHQLPVTLPELEDFKPHGRPEPPLAKADDDWLIVELDGKRYRRETNTMPQWAGSCWYYLRYIDPHNRERLIDPELERAWMPVDLYVGGAEHAVLHLLYSRFWHKVLYDRGYVTCPEPFGRLVNQGMILGEVEFTGYVDGDGNPVSTQHVRRDAEGNRVNKDGRAVESVKIAEGDVQKKGEGFVLVSDPAIKVDSRAFKMSKTRGNVVNPDGVVRDFGADSLRLYEMFMGPLEATKPWVMNGVGGVRGFLDRVWRLVVDEKADELCVSDAVVDTPCDEDQRRVLHQTIRKVTEDTESMSFNTAIAKMMEFSNHFTRSETRPREAIETFLVLLNPYAPHLCEELWRLLGHDESIALQPWPQWDEAALVESSIEIPVQLNGKLKTKINVSPDATQDQMIAAAMASELVTLAIDGKQVVKKIAVPGRMVNLVVK